MNKWAERLKVANAELRIAQKFFNQAQRRVYRLQALIAALEKRMEQSK